MRLLIALSLIVFLALACTQRSPSPDLSGVRLITPSTSLDIAKGENAFLIENVTMPAKDITWSIAELPDWLQVYPNEGVLTHGEKDLVRLSFQPINGPQAYNTQVDLELDNGFTKTIKVASDYQGCVAVPDNTIEPQALRLANSYSSSTIDQELLVKLKRPEDRKELLTDYEHYGVVLLKEGHGTQPDIFFSLANRDALITVLNQDSRVDYAEANTRLELLSTESSASEPSTSESADPAMQWHLQDFGVAEGWARIDIEKQLKQKPIIVAVIDSGFDLDHEDLATNLVPGCDFMADMTKADNVPGLLTTVGTGDYEHGTHVAGIVAAVADNKKGVSGVSYVSNVRVQPIKVFRDSGQGPSASDAADAIKWAAGLEVEGLLPNPTPADIINFSIGQTEANETLERAVNAVTEAGKIFVASSGNQGRSNGIMYPSAVSNAISVGSISSALAHSETSNYSETGRTVDVVAPGGSGTSVNEGSPCSGILSTVPENQYECKEGTSMATPFVSAILAMIWADNPEWTSEQVKEHLFESSAFHPLWQGQAAKFGRGVPCLDKALGTVTRCGAN